MKLKEYLEQFDTSIFQELKDASDLGFINTFITPNVDLMNHLLLLNSGERNVRQSIQTVPLPILARILLADYADSWNNLTKLDLTLNGSFADEIHIGSTNSLGNTNQVNNANNTNKVSAYDTDDLVIDDGSTSDAVTDTTNENNGNTLDEIYRFENVNKNLNIAQNLRPQRKIIEDIVNTITLSIY